MKRFCEDHLGQPIASPVIVQKIGNTFRRDVSHFAEEHEIPILHLKKLDRTRWDDRKLDDVHPVSRRPSVRHRFGVVAIVAAQEFQWVISSTKKTGGGAGVWFDWNKPARLALWARFWSGLRSDYWTGAATFSGFVPPLASLMAVSPRVEGQ